MLSYRRYTQLLGKRQPNWYGPFAEAFSSVSRAACQSCAVSLSTALQKLPCYPGLHGITAFGDEIFYRCARATAGRFANSRSRCWCTRLSAQRCTGERRRLNRPSFDNSRQAQRRGVDRERRGESGRQSEPANEGEPLLAPLPKRNSYSLI